MSGGGMSVAAPISEAVTQSNQVSNQQPNPVKNSQNTLEPADTFVPTQPPGQYGSFANRFGQGNFRSNPPIQTGAMGGAPRNDFGNTQNYIRNAVQMSNSIYGNPYAQQSPMTSMYHGYQNPFQGYTQNPYMQQSPYQFYQPQGMYQTYQPQGMYGGYQNPYGGIAGLMF